MGRFMLEAQEPCGFQVWVQIYPPEKWKAETGTHDGLWSAKSKADVVEQFHKAYPNPHPDAKPYRQFRVTTPPHHFMVVPVDSRRPDSERRKGN